MAPPRAQVGSIDLAYVTATVTEVFPETADTATLRLVTDDAGLLAAKPGQFVMVAMPAFAIPPISISRLHPDGLELTIRASGPATGVLTRLHPGAQLGLRGPLGRPWPIEDAYGRDVAIVAGGIGLAPLRGLLDQVLAERARFTSVRVYLGRGRRRIGCSLPSWTRSPPAAWMCVQSSIAPALTGWAAWASSRTSSETRAQPART